MFDKRIIAFIFLLLITSTSVFPSENLVNTLKGNIQELEQKYNELKHQAKTVSDEIELTSRKIEILREKIRLLKVEKSETEKNIKQLKENIKQLDKKIEEIKKYLRERIRELYKKGDYKTLEAMLTPQRESELMYQLNTLAYLGEKDRKALKSLKALTREKKLKLAMLEATRKDLENTLTALSKTRVEFYKTLKEKKRLYRRLKRQKSKYLALLKERNRLLKLLVESLSKKPTIKNPSPVPMDKFKGLLSLPVRGRIIERFGTSRIGRYKAKVRNNGITLKVRKGRKVRAFYDGVIVYADWYKSYGKLVIIDHGFGYYTFYAHLDKIFVKINQIVAKGDIIGTTGNTASLKGYVLHFEIWHNKKPLNPLKWIKKR